MGKFLNGIMVGMGIGFLVAPKKGEEMRSMLKERLSQLQSKLPSERTSNQPLSENMQTNNYAKPVETNQSPSRSFGAQTRSEAGSSRVDENASKYSSVKPNRGTTAGNESTNEVNKKPSSTTDSSRNYNP